MTYCGVIPAITTNWIYCPKHRQYLLHNNTSHADTHNGNEEAGEREKERERGQSRAGELIRMLLITVWSTVSYDNSNPMHVVATINCRICRVPCATYRVCDMHSTNIRNDAIM